MQCLRWIARKRSTKVFGVGTIKTGTTSLGEALAILGFNHTNKRREFLLRCYGEENYRPIFKFADLHDSFEDWPWPMLYRTMDERYPNSRFILTMRRDEDVWLESVVKHAKWVGPTYGRSLFFNHDTPIGNARAYLKVYRRHAEEVRRYFNGRPGKLLEVCWESGHGWRELCEFLGRDVPQRPFPVLNTSSNRVWK